MNHIDHELIRRMTRAQTWERAKGELNALRHTFTFMTEDGEVLVEAGSLDDYEWLLKEFIKGVEDAGLHK